MSFKIAINRPRPISKPRRYTAILRTRAETSDLKSPGVSVHRVGRLDQQYGNQILEVLLNCYNTSTPIHTFNLIYFFVVFFPIIWFAIVSETLSSICRTSRYPFVAIVLSEVLLLAFLARYTAAMIILSTMIGSVALSVRPITTGIKVLFPFVSGRLSRLEGFFAQHAGSLQELLEDISPIWTEDYCEVTSDDQEILSGSTGPSLLPPTLAREPPHVFPKVTYEIQPQVQKPDFDPEGWLLV